MIIRQSTARTILVGPVLDSTGAAKTDEVVASIKVTKNGTVGAADGSATLDHDHAGKYRLALTANDCDTVGVLEISLNSGTNDMPVKGLNVVETAIWDALFADGATGLLPANVTQFGGTNLTSASGIPEVKVASIANNAITAAAIADAAIDTATFATGTTLPRVTLVDTCTTNSDMRGTDNAALAATALSTATWTSTIAGRIDVAISSRLAPLVAGRAIAVSETTGKVTAEAVALDSASTALLNDIPTTAEFEARTLASASYATASQINSLQVNTRASVQVPVEIETPDSGTQIWKIRLFLFDSDGNMEAPDSTPTIALVNASGTDRSSRLSAATTLSTGAYSWDYTSTDDDTEEQLNWTFTVVEGGLTRIYPATSYVVEETAYRFTATDRSTLNSRSSSTEVTTVGTAVAAVSTKLGTPAGASVSADIASVKTDTGTTIPNLIDAIEGGGGSGTGARTVTITVNDGTSTLQNAVVRMTEGVNTYTATTNASGVATFNLNDATYTVSIGKDGYSYAGTTLVVNGTETATYSMTAVSITPSTGNFTTAYQTVFSREGAVAAGVTVRMQIVRLGTSYSGAAYNGEIRTEVSGVDGVVQFPNVPKDSEILNWIGDKKAKSTTSIPSTAGSTYALPSIVSAP